MRMEELKKPIGYWVDFILFLVENNITKIHISNEYSSYNKIKKIFSNPKVNKIKSKLEVIIKCSSPNFNNTVFNEQDLIDQIKAYQKDLGIHKFYAIQWLWRGNLKNEAERLNNLKDNIIEINKSIKKIKKKYSNLFFSFPYTENFLRLSCDKIFLDGYTIYINLKEKKFVKFLKLKKKFIAIRPFIKIKKNQRQVFLKKILQQSIKKKNIIGIMISFRNKLQIKSIIDILNEKNF